VPRAQRRVPPGRVGALLAALRVGRQSAQFRYRSDIETGPAGFALRTAAACLDKTKFCLPPWRALWLRG
jgi:hypothetical protein